MVMINGSHHNKTTHQHNFFNEIRFNFVDVITMVLLTCILIIGVFGNVLVIYVFGTKTGKRRQRFEMFLLLLGFVDLISSFIIPTSFFYLTSTIYKRWDFGFTGCKIIPSLLQISVTISQGVLILISFERYHTLTRPFQSRISLWRIVLVMVGIILLSVILVSPYSYNFRIHNNEYYGVKTCLPDGTKLTISLLSAVLQVCRDFIALGVMLFFGYKINASLTKQHNNLTWERKKISSKGRKVLRFLIVVFAILTLPVDIYQCLIYILFSTSLRLSKTLYSVIIVVNTFLNVLQTSNSVVNVFIYSRVHNNFKLKCLRGRYRRERCRTECEEISRCRKEEL